MAERRIYRPQPKPKAAEGVTWVSWVVVLCLSGCVAFMGWGIVHAGRLIAAVVFSTLNWE